MSVDTKKFRDSLKTTLLPEKEEFKYIEFYNEPLFAIMIYKTNVVAFAELNGNVDQMREISFNFFRRQFNDNQREWNKYDLSLVYCLTSENINDSLKNAILLDPYFCKKYVIDLTSKEKLENKFGQLPFFPLLPKTVKTINRPISAKELLKEFNVKTELINGLINPGKMSAISIVKKCLDEKDIPMWQKIKNTQQLFENNISEVNYSTRLKHLTVNNFRAYKHFDFDLDADVIILFGNNGLGKTSFFEAIDFLCTGSVSRLDAKFDVSSKLSRFNESLKYLNSTDIKETSAKLIINCNSKEKELMRNLDDRSSAMVDGNKSNRKDTLQFITHPKDDLLTMSIDNFVNLFRSSHMFGQDMSTLTDKKFMKESELDENIISRMLSFQDYTEGINKGEEVLVLLSRELKKDKENITKLDRHINELNNEIDTFDMKFKNIGDISELNNKAQEVINSLKEKYNIIFPKNITSDSIKDIRANLQGKVKTTNDYISDITKIFDKYDGIKKEVIIFETTQKKIEKIIDQDKTDNENKMILEKNILKEEDRIKSIIKTKNNVQKTIEDINWLLLNYKEYDNIVESVIKEEKEIEILSDKLSIFPKELEKITNEREKLIIQIEKNKKDLEQIESKLLEFNEIKSRINDYKTQSEEIIRKDTKRKQLVDKSSALKKDFSAINTKINTINSNLSTFNEQIANMQNDQTELKSLLQNIEKYILSNECPVCGNEYKSKEELLERLQIRIGRKNETLEQLLRKKDDLLKENRELINMRIKRESDLKDTNTQLETIEYDIKDLTYKNQLITKLAINLDIKLEDEKIANTISNSIESILNEKQNNKEILLKLDKLKTDIDKTILDINLKIRECENGMASKNALLRGFQNGKRKLDDNVSGSTLTFSNKYDEIKSVQSKYSEEVLKLNEDKNTMDKLLSDLNVKLRESKDKTIDNNNILKNLQRTLLKSEKIINEFNLSVKNSRLNKDISKVDIEILINETEKESEKLNNSIKVINELEITLESLQTSALVTKLKIEIDKVIAERGKSKSINIMMEKWLIYFKKLVDELKVTRNKSIEDYINNLGPLSSTIQKRLRSVYNFGEIKLQSSDGKVSVKTQHSGNELRPTDYFSESQIQILILSLFFSTALTQNWSAFSPILLDDPVTHFDDMNCYAFTDLVRGIVNTSKNRYQFIISTCEERLYALMKQKFKKMNGKAIFYEFKTIGENGPVIDKCTVS